MKNKNQMPTIAKRLLIASLFSAIMGGAFFFASAPHAQAAPKGASLVVNTLSDADNGADGVCSLREAMIATNLNTNYHECISSGYGADTITFSVTGTITLGSALPAIADDLTITGPGAVSLTLSGNNAVRVLHFAGPATTINLSGVTIAYGKETEGGGIYLVSFASAVNITSTVFYSNTGTINAGAISNNGSTMNISNSTFYSNTGISGGGAIQSNSGSANIFNTTFYSNSTTSAGQGGGLYANDSVVTVINSTFYSNTAGAGGGIYTNSGTLNISNSTFYNNTAIHVFGGGGIYNFATATITNSTFSGNNAAHGGGIYNNTPGTLTVTNSTLAGNSASVSAGGINVSAGAVTLRNSIVANNTAPSNGNCLGTIVDGGNNLQWNPNSDCGFALAAGDPKLAPLGNYGGPTLTMALLRGSAAINTGSNANCPPTDQRGVIRPIGLYCDIGAFEAPLQLFLPLVVR